jgi:hypothetical protein
MALSTLNQIIAGMQPPRVALTHQASGTIWVEHDASSNGNLLWTAARPVGTGASGTIGTGKLITAIT